MATLRVLESNAERIRHRLLEIGVDAELVSEATKVHLITVAAAVEKYADKGLTSGRLYNWVQRGHIEPADRIAKSPGRGGQLLFDEDDIRELLETPPTPGRKPA